MKKKKKKLKKKIKKLEKDIKWLKDCHANLHACYQQLFSRDQFLMDNITNLEKDNKYYKEWMDRSGVDYKSWFNFEEKTCDTCKWKPLMEQGGQDIPCMVCTADDKKMWKSKN